MPDDLVRGRLVQTQPEGRFALPHLACDVVTPPEFVGEAPAVAIEHQAAHAAQRLGGQKLDLRIRVVGLHQARRVHLNPLHVDGLPANRLAHLDAVTGAVLAVRSRQVHEVRAELCEQGVLGEIGTETTSRENHWAKLFLISAAPSVDQPDAAAGVVSQQGVGSRLGDDARAICSLSHLLEHLNQCVSDRHAWEALFAPMCSGRRMSAKPRDQG
mmetsp:Transcript_44387/g.112424  ORF Transcript_44387/g.112424 Transcript_44387/m.112424 type:complete len:214 (-) Transcript_44387:438-1079(-)